MLSDSEKQRSTQFTNTSETKTRASCTCADIPAFRPGQRHFRLTSPGDLAGCQHYVAVSYSWKRCPKRVLQSDTSSKYFVETSAGIRTGNAPVDVIDRAVAFAASHDLGLLWIDQEVIDQDDATDKSQGIQVMDIVYERSLWPIAILDTTIVSQDQFGALDLILKQLHDDEVEEGDENVDDEDVEDEDVENEDVEEKVDEDVDKDATHLLELLSPDLYFTRSWTLQESLAALNMKVLIQVAPDIQVSPRFPAVHQTGDIYYTMIDFNYALEGSGVLSSTRLIRSKKERFYIVICLAFAEAPSRRLSRSAAEVLAMLETRSNTILSDRLAIIANLCAYEKRLDTTALEATTHGFSTAILVLSLMNGDLSLLSGYGQLFVREPEYLWPMNPQLSLGLWQRDESFDAKSFGWGWGPPNRGRLRYLPYCAMRVFDTQLLRIYPAILLPSGLRTSGFLWKRRTDINFQSLKEEHLDIAYQQGPIDHEIAKTIKWKTLLFLAQNSQWELAEALWRFECYDGDFFTHGEKGYRPYALTEVLDRETHKLKDFGDPEIRNDSDCNLLFRLLTSSWWLQYSVVRDGQVGAWTCVSSNKDDGSLRAAFDSTTEQYEDE